MPIGITKGAFSVVTLSKYKDHCPLARQTRIYQRAGVELHLQHAGRLDHRGGIEPSFRSLELLRR